MDPHRIIHDARQCWNWQTGTFEVRVRRRMGSSPICRTKNNYHPLRVVVIFYESVET